MNCPKCDGRMVRYQGFDEHTAEESFECINGCAPNEETTKPGLSGCIEFPSDWDVSWVELAAHFETTVRFFPELSDFSVKFDHSFTYLRGTDKRNGAVSLIAIRPTPTRSGQAHTSVISSASSSSTQPRHKPVYPHAGLPAPASAPTRSGQDLDLDDLDQCTLRRQESGLPPLSGKPTKRYVMSRQTWKLKA